MTKPQLEHPKHSTATDSLHSLLSSQTICCFFPERNGSTIARWYHLKMVLYAADPRVVSIVLTTKRWARTSPSTSTNPGTPPPTKLSLELYPLASESLEVGKLHSQLTADPATITPPPEKERPAKARHISSNGSVRRFFHHQYTASTAITSRGSSIGRACGS